MMPSRYPNYPSNSEKAGVRSLIFLRGDNRGIALVLVLWVLTFLSVLVGEFSHTMRTELNITRNFRDETLCYYYAKAGMNLALYHLVFDRALAGQAQMEQIDGDEKGLTWHPGRETIPVPFGDGLIEIEIRNESGKININAAQGTTLRMMLNPFELDDAEKDIIIDSIMDWRDKDKFHRINGAEDDYYLSLPTPYRAKNSDFDSIEELLLVRGITPEIFYSGLNDMVTIYPKNDETSGVRSSSAIRLNINEAPSEILSALPQMTQELIALVLEHRDQESFQSISQVFELLGAETGSAIRPYISTELVPYYTIRSVGSVRKSRTRRGIQAVLEIDPEPGHDFKVLEWRDNIKMKAKTTGAPL